jgi:hypothetical protein
MLSKTIDVDGSKVFCCASRCQGITHTLPNRYGGMSGSMGGFEEEALKRPAHGLICAWPTSNIPSAHQGLS